MPDNGATGSLEAFLSSLVPTGDPLWPLAQRSTDQAKNLGARFSDASHPKAELHTWLAWQKQPGRPFGTALTARYFQHDAPAAQAFVDWYRQLVGDTTTR